MRLQKNVEAEKPEKQSCKLFEKCAAAKEMWDYKNNTVKPEEVRASSNQAVFWLCKERGHSFRRALNSFVFQNQSCPACKHLRSRVIGKPYMMKFWDAEKNKANPEDISAKSLDTAFWKCPNCGYSWEAVIASRKNDLCPCCNVGVRIMGGFNDFSTVYPELRMDFKQELNPDIDAATLGIGSHTRLKWQCHVCCYQWMAPIYGRTRKDKNGNIYITKCPACARNKRVISFGQQYPDLIARYSERNKQKLSELTGTDYRKKFLWICETHGEYSSSLVSMLRTIKEGLKGCPYCHGTMVKPEDSFGTVFSELAKEWARENELTPYDVTPQSKYKATWRCEKGHTWQAFVYTRSQGYGYCRECYPFGKRVKSFSQVHPEYRDYYSNKNGTLFENHSWCSQEEAIWVCQKGHEFTSSFSSFNNKAQFSCPVCTYRKIIPGLNDFKTEYGKYVESYDEIRNTDPVDHISPKNSDGSIWWICSEGHHFQRSVRAHIGSKGVCPVCSKRVLVRGINDLQTLHSQIADVWDYEANGCAPEDCFYSAYKYYGFCCNLGHHYFTAVKRVVENDYRCLVCDGIMLDVEGNSLKATDPQLATEWSPNNDRGPESVMCDYRTPALWLCPDCGG